MTSAEINNKIYNKLRSFAKDEVKKQHRLKDKVLYRFIPIMV